MERRHDDYMAEDAWSLLLEESDHSVAIDPGHHQIEENEIVISGFEFVDGLETIADAFDLKAFELENSGYHQANLGVVIDNQSSPG